MSHCHEGFFNPLFFFNSWLLRGKHGLCLVQYTFFEPKKYRGHGLLNTVISSRSSSHEDSWFRTRTVEDKGYGLGKSSSSPILECHIRHQLVVKVWSLDITTQISFPTSFFSLRWMLWKTCMKDHGRLAWVGTFPKCWEAIFRYKVQHYTGGVHTSPRKRL